MDTLPKGRTARRWRGGERLTLGEHLVSALLDELLELSVAGAGVGLGEVETVGKHALGPIQMCNSTSGAALRPRPATHKARCVLAEPS